MIDRHLRTFANREPDIRSGGAMPSYRPVKSVTRALLLLSELNSRGLGTIAELHRKTGLPKPTLVRLLETLDAAGYVSRDIRQGGYQVTSKVYELSRGFQGAPLVIEAARPWAIDLTRKLKWPVAIGILDHDALVVRFSTIVDSPMSPFHFTLNSRLSLISRAMGRAYLANCPATERRELLRRLDNSANAEDRPNNRAHVVRAIIRGFRSQHFSERDPDVEPRSSQTIAVPIMLGPNVLATIGLSFFRTALPRHKVAEQLAAPLIQAARRIEQSLALVGAGQSRITSTSRSSSRSARVA